MSQGRSRAGPCLIDQPHPNRPPGQGLPGQRTRTAPPGQAPRLTRAGPAERRPRLDAARLGAPGGRVQLSLPGGTRPDSAPAARRGALPGEWISLSRDGGHYPLDSGVCRVHALKTAELLPAPDLVGRRAEMSRQSAPRRDVDDRDAASHTCFLASLHLAHSDPFSAKAPQQAQRPAPPAAHH